MLPEAATCSHILMMPQKILKLLVDVKNDNPKKFGDKIDMLIERVA